MLPALYDMDGQLQQAKLEEVRLGTTKMGLQMPIVADVEMLPRCIHGEATDNAEEYMMHAVAAIVNPCM